MPRNLRAQEIQQHATLLGWEQRLRNFMLDRSHNFGGTHFNRGLFREHLNEMSAEHEIDLMTYRYTLFDDYRWETAEHAYRLTMGSLNATRFAVENSIKSDIALNTRNEVSIEGYQSENIRTNRFLFHLGYQHSFPGNHKVGFRHSITNEKSDLDATFYYRYGSFSKGMIELDMTVMDWASNTVQQLAEGSRNRYNQRYETTHQYRNHPELFSIRFTAPQQGNVRAELIGGLQTYSRKRVEQHADTLHYMDEEWAHYLGGLLEYSHAYYTVGLTYQRSFSKLKRAPEGETPYDLDFGNWQISDRAGFFAAGRFRSWRLEQWIWYEHNNDRLQGEKVPGDLTPNPFERIPFNYVENRLKLKSRILYDPPKSGFKTGLEFHADYIYPQGEIAENGIRNWDFRWVYPIVRNRNDRLTYTIGYRFNPNFYFLAGVSYDLDKDKQSGIGLPRVTGTPTWFDGGFGRFAISW